MQRATVCDSDGEVKEDNQIPESCQMFPIDSDDGDYDVFNDAETPNYFYEFGEETMW